MIFNRAALPRGTSGRQLISAELKARKIFEKADLAQATLDALPQQVCVLSENGTITRTNRAWRESGVSDAASVCRTRPGDDFEELCSAMYPLDVRKAADFALKLKQLLDGKYASIEFEYSLLNGTRSNWYRGTATGFENETERWAALVQVDITESKIQAAKLTRLNHLHAISSEFNSLTLRERNRDELLRSACKIVIDDGRFMMAWIGIVENGEHRVTPIASAGNVGDFLESAAPALYSTLPDSTVPIARVIRGQAAIFSNDVAFDPQILVKAKLAARGIKSLALLPLVVDQKGIGVFAIYSADIDAFDAEEMTVLNQLAGDVSFSMEYLEKERQLDRLVHHDIVTGLPNRLLFTEYLQRTVADAHRDGTPAALLLIDFDGFKVVSDTLGRANGDEVLRLIAGRLVACAGPSVTIARLEGAEFAVILSRLDYPSDVALVAERILLAMAVPFEVARQDSYLTAHIGISGLPNDTRSAHVLLTNADTAIFSARRENRHNFRFFTAAMNVDAYKKSQLETGLRRALEREEFVVHYQPKVDSISGSIVGMEALLRWDSLDSGLVQPLDFIPLLEETGLIVAVGEWVLKTACRQVASWQKANVKPVQIAVNLSARQFQQEGLPDMIAKTLNEFDISASYIEMEITESSLMSDSAATVLILDRLRALGIHVSIDDFGTGYSSLSYLKSLPLDALKIDRSFISDVTVNPDDAAITRAIITMAHSMNLKVIAEGVETEEQFAFLRSNNCDEAQGYLFSRPLTAADATKLLISRTELHAGHAEGDEIFLPTILLVDDDKWYRSLLHELFNLDGYRILTASGAKAAFDVLALHDVDLIISDQNMPQMQGIEFLRRVRRIYPAVVRIMMTAQSDAETVTAAVNDGEVFKFFIKERDEDLLHEEVSRRFHQNARSAQPA